jgi:hypothetical protein
LPELVLLALVMGIWFLINFEWTLIENHYEWIKPQFLENRKYGKCMETKILYLIRISYKKKGFPRLKKNFLKPKIKCKMNVKKRQNIIEYANIFCIKTTWIIHNKCGIFNKRLGQINRPL